MYNITGKLDKLEQFDTLAHSHNKYNKISKK